MFSVQYPGSGGLLRCLFDCYSPMELHNTSLLGHQGQEIKGCLLYGLCMPSSFSKAHKECRGQACLPPFERQWENVMTTHVCKLQHCSKNMPCLYMHAGFRLGVRECCDHLCLSIQPSSRKAVQLSTLSSLSKFCYHLPPPIPPKLWGYTQPEFACMCGQDICKVEQWCPPVPQSLESILSVPHPSSQCSPANKFPSHIF